MKIEKLTDNKIRIILDTDELSKQNIDIKSLINNTDIAQGLFKQILKRAEKEVGFVVADSKLLIEAFVSSEGFFVVTFTKFKPDISKQKTHKLKIKRKSSFPSYKNAIFAFDSFDEFCNFCTYANNRLSSDYLSKVAKKILLYEYNDIYYLSISQINKKFEKLPLFYASISEFSKLVSSSMGFDSKLAEHGNLIFKHNAIKNGIKYFV